MLYVLYVLFVILVSGISIFFGFILGVKHERNRISNLTIPCHTCGGSGWDPKGTGTSADVCSDCGAQRYMPLWLFFGREMNQALPARRITT